MEKQNQSNNLTQQTVSGLIWKFAERIGAQLVTAIISIVLARILLPEDYGVVSIVTILITICNVFVSNGFGNSLIQKKDADEADFSSVFYASLVLSVGLYAILFFTAPYIARFYKNDLLSPVLRVMGLRVPIAAINSVQQAYVSRKMAFRKFFFATLIGTLISGAVGLYMAYDGYGVWALVGQYLTNVTIDTVMLWITVKWRPKRLFSFKKLKGLLAYGWKLLASGLLDTVYTELRSLVIGKKYSSADLAYYDKGKQFPSLIAVNVNASFNSVLFSAMSKVQDDREKVKQVTRRSIRLSSYILMPCMVGLAVVAEPFVRVLLTDKWLAAVPYLQIMCFVYAFYPIHTANLTAISAVGRSDLFLILEIVKKAVGIVSLLISMWFGVIWIALTSILTTLISSFINAFPNKKLLGYGYLEQIKDLLPAIGLSVLMGVPVYLMNFIPMNVYALLCLQVLTGAAIYLAASIAFKSESFGFILGYVKKAFNTKGARKGNMKEEKKKKLMLLGGSAQQVVAIEKAKELGYYTVLCDFLTDNPGQYAADKFYLVSTTDKEAVLEVAKKEKIDGVLAYASDPAAPTAAYVAEKLNLPGNPYQSVEILCEKDKFRKFLKDNGFNCPQAKGYCSVAEAVEDLKSGIYKFPVIVKPVDSSGSKGATVLHGLENAGEYCENALSFSRKNRIIIEEFIEKKHSFLIGGDIFVLNGKVVFWGLLNCHRDDKVNSLVPVGKSYPLEIGESDFDNVKSVLQGIVDRLGIRFGAMNVELVIDRNNDVYPIDIGPRSGGNMIPDLLGMIFGVDIIEATVKTAMGQTSIDFDSLKTAPTAFVSSYNLHSAKNGIFDSIEFSPALEKHILRKNIYVKSGDKAEYFENASKALGVIFLGFSDLDEMKFFLGTMENNVKILFKDED